MYSDDAADSGATSSQESFGVLAEWVAALHGGGCFQQALDRLSRLFSAEAGLAVRLDDDHRRCRQVALAEPAGLAPVRRRTMARDILGDSLSKLRPGAVWFLSDDHRDSSFEDREWLSERRHASGIHEVAVIVLGTNDGLIDYCEFQFSHPVSRPGRARMTELAPALTKSWAGRLPGTVERLLARKRTLEDRAQAPQGDLLSPTNPAGLSRSEYRICALVREGLLAQAIAEDLSIRESTVRSHLRSIYAKTGASGHVDLLHRLTRSAPAHAERHDVPAAWRLAG
jgi:DNA-binding CsgD family transcriptional regulator